MPLTPETLPKHELTGLHVEVVDAPNPDLVGIAGRVVMETMKTLHVACDPASRRGREEASSEEPPSAERGEEDGEPRVCQVQKLGSVFEFALTDDAAAAREGAGTASEPGAETAGGAGQSGPGHDAAYVTVDGARLLSRPARRTEDAGEPTWH